MPFIHADRVKESTTTTGTGTVTLSNSSPTGYRTFGSVMSNSDTCLYCIAGRTSAEWEIGIGTYTTSGTTLARNTVLSSSNSGSLVTFSSGTKDVFIPGAPANWQSTYVAGNTGAAPAPSLSNGPVQIWTMDNNVTWGAPTNAWRAGQELRILAVQNGTGGYTTAWNAAYRNAPAWGAGTANQKASAVFVYDGTSWQYVGGSSAFA